VEETARMGWRLEFERFPAVTFSNCTTIAQCMEERPECFPTNNAGYIHHGLVEGAETSAKMIRGVLGNWCSHLRLLEHMARAKHAYNFFLLLEDDFILSDKFAAGLNKVLVTMPHYWNLIALDTFGGGGRVPEQDSFGSESTLGLRLNSLSSTMNSYWGAHAWLVNDEHLQRFVSFYRSTPAIPLDWVTKASHPLHMGIWSLETGGIHQRQHVGASDLVALPAACVDMKGSDLLGGGMQYSMRLARSPAQASSAISQAVVNDVPIARRPAAPERRSQPAKVVVLGMFGSGAQFVQDLIRSNLAKPGAKALEVSDHVWRHIHPSRLIAGDPEWSHTVAAIVVRHPFSQLRAIQRKQSFWHLSCRNEGAAGSHGIDSGCGLTNGTSGFDERACRPGQTPASCWNSIPEAWNSYMSSYKSIQRGMFKKVIRLRYEDVVENPRLALMQVGLAAGMHPSTIDAEISEAVFWGQTGDADYVRALHKLSVKDYGTNFKCPELHALCRRLNRGLLFSNGYHGCQADWPGFAQLIYNGTDYQRHPERVQSVFTQTERLSCL